MTRTLFTEHRIEERGRNGYLTVVEPLVSTPSNRQVPALGPDDPGTHGKYLVLTALSLCHSFLCCSLPSIEPTIPAHHVGMTSIFHYQLHEPNDYLLFTAIMD